MLLPLLKHNNMNTAITIYTDNTGRVYLYQNEDSTRTPHEVEQLPPIPPRKTDNNLYDGYHIYKNGKFTFGYDLNANKCYGAINDLKAKLNKTKHIVEKEVEGCDMTEYGDWKQQKVEWRAEINRIEELIKTNPIV